MTGGLLLVSLFCWTLTLLSASAFHTAGTVGHHPQRISVNFVRFPTTRRQPSFQKSVEGDFDADAIAKAREESQSGSVKARIRALYKFTRPHTIRGTILGSIAGTIRALVDTPGAIANANWATMLPRALIGMIALLLGNAFIVGINQIFDESIDKLNKPFLPVASGEMSRRFAWLAVIVSAVVGPALVHQFFPALLFKLYSFGLFLGLIYSVPPIRTKRNPVLAGLTIACVRGFLLNFGVYYAVKDAVGAAFSWSPKVSFIARFMTLFATVIAITKDLPDIEGDKVRCLGEDLSRHSSCLLLIHSLSYSLQAFQIETFATKIGVGRMAKASFFCLFLNYIQAIATGVLAKPGTFRAIPMIGGHIALASMLIVRFRQLEPESMKSVKLFYKNIWDLFYLEYALYTLI